MSSSKQDRQFRALRQLMPWNWDARLEEHPPGEKSMHDFQDVLSCTYDRSRRRRSEPLSTPPPALVATPKAKTMGRGQSGSMKKTRSAGVKVPRTETRSGAPIDELKVDPVELISASPLTKLKSATDEDRASGQEAADGPTEAQELNDMQGLESPGGVVPGPLPPRMHTPGLGIHATPCADAQSPWQAKEGGEPAPCKDQDPSPPQAGDTCPGPEAPVSGPPLSTPKCTAQAPIETLEPSSKPELPPVNRAQPAQTPVPASASGIPIAGTPQAVPTQTSTAAKGSGSALRTPGSAPEQHTAPRQRHLEPESAAEAACLVLTPRGVVSPGVADPVSSEPARAGPSSVSTGPPLALLAALSSLPKTLRSVGAATSARANSPPAGCGASPCPPLFKTPLTAPLPGGSTARTHRRVTGESTASEPRMPVSMVGQSAGTQAASPHAHMTSALLDSSKRGRWPVQEWSAAKRQEVAWLSSSLHAHERRLLQALAPRVA